MITIRPTREDDIDAVMPLFDQARQTMRRSGNMHQWTDGYPSREVVERDVALGQSYVCIEMQAADACTDACVVSRTDDRTEGRIDACTDDRTDDRTDACTEGRIDARIVGTFAFIPGIEPTYLHIYQGRWLDDTLPYATIHRLAGAAGTHGLADACFSWCAARAASLRVDTHRDNVIMRHLMQRLGFTYCGIIYLMNGDKRLAYQKLC